MLNNPTLSEGSTAYRRASMFPAPGLQSFGHQSTGALVCASTDLNRSAGEVAR